MENIVILGNGVDWGAVCLEDFRKYNAEIINTVFPCKNRSFIEIASKAILSPERSKMFPRIFRYKIYDYYINYMNLNKYSDSWIIIYDHNRLCNDEKFLSYIKRRIPNIKLIYMFTNIAKLSYASDHHFLEKMKEYYDLVYAFDPEDSKRYGFDYSPLLYSVREYDSKPHKQLFYIGKAKDRYDTIINIYNKVKNYSIQKIFFIVDVPEEKQVKEPDIVYNRYMPYSEALKYIQESSCLLDIIQGESTGFTIKVCEAVAYDKLLITTNQHIKETPFYDERYIRVIKNADDIDEAFFDNWQSVQYNIAGKEFFSIDTFVRKVRRDLANR